jgi:hypothetical protein
MLQENYPVPGSVTITIDNSTTPNLSDLSGLIFGTAKAPTTTALTSSANPSIYGQPVTFTATVNPIPDRGSMQFADNGTNLGGAISFNGASLGIYTYTTSTLSVGSHTITGNYSGDANFTSSSSVLTQTVESARDLKTNAVTTLQNAKTNDKQFDKVTRDIIGHITDSLAPGLWIDGNHLVFTPRADWKQSVSDRFTSQGKTLDDSDMDDDARVGVEFDGGTANGINVFHDEKAAADIMGNSLKQYEGDIATLSKAKKLSADQKADLDAMNKIVPVYPDVLVDLVKADKLLAQVAITDAKETPVKDSKWVKITAFELKQADAEFAAANASDTASDSIIHYSHAWFHAEMAIQFAKMK